MTVHRLVIGLVLGPAWWIVLAEPAHAYLDPGAGSFLLQALLAIALAAVVTLKNFWYRLWRRVARLKPHRHQRGTGESKAIH